MRLRNNTVISNTSNNNGGGLYLSASDATLASNVVADNQAAGKGSGIYLAGGLSKLLHSTIARNSGGDGSGLHVTTGLVLGSPSDSTVVLTNTILVSHTVGITVTAGNTATLEATFWGTGAWANEADWGGDGAIFTGTVHVRDDPAFVDPAVGDYHILATSEARDKGVSTDEVLDIDGDYRPLAAPLDMGADEVLPDAPVCLARLNGIDPPYASIQAAVNASTAPTDVVEVHGVCEDAVAWNDWTYVAVLTKTLTLRGGYSQDFTTWNPVTYPTVLNGRVDGSVLAIGAGISPTVEYLNLLGGRAVAGGGLWSASAEPILRGLQIVFNGAGHGGGLHLRGGSGNATVVSNTIRNNGAIKGGGLYLEDSAATLQGNTVTNNRAGDGGGLYLEDSTAALNSNAISRNEAGSGGGLYLFESAAILSGNTVTGNLGVLSGGGLHLDQSDATLVNTVVADNWAGSDGSGLYIRSSAPQLLHTTIARNDGGDGSGVHGITSSVVTLTNTILVSHTVGITVSVGNTATLNGVLWFGNTANTGGAGTITVAEANTGNPAFAANGYHLTGASAARDQGVDAGVTDDVDGQTRDAKPDLGADEYVRVCYDITRDRQVTVDDIQAVASRWHDPNQYHIQYDVAPIPSDSVINVLDVMTMAAHWGDTCP